MSVEDNKDLVGRFLREGLDRRNMDVVDEVFAPDHLLLSPELGTGQVEGTDVIKGALEHYHSDGAGAGCNILNQIAEGEWVSTSFTLGREEAEHMGIMTSRVVGGKIRESFVVARDVSAPDSDSSLRKILN
jgi:hypothetical protein